jgi:threonine dehydrogenase-like Zn-dependent dehydrogenase
MKAWVYRKEREADAIHIFQEEVKEPQVSAGRVILKIEKVSVCGTDEALFRGSLAKVPDGIIPGHEFYGEVVELGEGVTGLQKGQKIAGESHYYVPETKDQGIIGLWGPELEHHKLLPPINGAYAEYLSLPAECAHPVPGELISDGFWPSLFEAVGNDYFLIKRVLEIQPLRTLGIFGAGPHGLFAQIFARHFGIQHIAAFEPDPFRREFSSRLQAADETFDPTDRLIEKSREFTNGIEFDVTLDMVGKQGQGFELCCETTRDGGTIFLFGLFSGERFSIDGVSGNEIIFQMKSLTHRYKGKTLSLHGITGREGIWSELIQTVSGNQTLQEYLMRPIHVMGSLDQLGADTRHPKSGILKRAYHKFS